MKALPLWIAASLVMAVGPTLAQTASVTIDLGPGDGERRTVSYQCGEAATPVSVTYLDFAPNFLALVPVEEQTVVFVAVPSERGEASYVSGDWIWTEQDRTTATLRSASARPNADPILECSSAAETP